VRETGAYLEFAIQHPHLHNCGADIYLKNADTSRMLIRSIDKELYREASIAFGTYAQFYMLWWREFEITGSWLNKYFEPKDMAKNTYRAVHGNYKQLYFLPLNNEFLFIDRFGGRLVRFSNDLATLTEEPYSFDDCPPEEYLHTDSMPPANGGCNAGCVAWTNWKAFAREIRPKPSYSTPLCGIYACTTTWCFTLLNATNFV
jgi:hypothetical protein